MTRIRVTELDKITFLVQSLLVMGPHIQIRVPLSTAVTPPFGDANNTKIVFDFFTMPTVTK